MAKAATTEIPEAKIRQVIWMLKTGKTKKACCEHLGISYNVKKLDSIIEDFHARIDREEALKKAARAKVFTDAEKRHIADAYLNGETQTGLAKQYYISPQKLKTILLEMKVPIRGRGKNSEAKTDHIVQDLEIRFKPRDRVFIAKYNAFGIVDRVFDEDYLEYLENGRQRYVETYEFKPDNKTGMHGKHIEPIEGIHYEIYWQLSDGNEMKMKAVLHMRNLIIKNLEATGREFYSVWKDDDFGGFHYLNRDELYPIRAA
jgi:hypothetical protein